MYLLPLFPFLLFVPYRISPQSQSIALSCVCRRCIKGQPGSSWPQRMTIVSCAMPPSVHWQSHRPIIKARITPRKCGSLRPSRTPTTCRFNYLFIIVRVATIKLCFTDLLDGVKVILTLALLVFKEGRKQRCSPKKKQKGWQRIQTCEKPP